MQEALHRTTMSAPPGASYRVSNALIIAKRRLLSLEDPIQIRFDQEWRAGDPLCDWYTRQSSRYIQKLQLRKEKEGPFFHEYVVFRLLNGSYFRIDRRQSPAERSPLDCIYEGGVEAYDTIEEITSFNDELYCRSNLLMELEMSHPHLLELAFVLKVCRAIHKHPAARFYTLQRYNCYFFAQTITVCAIRSRCRTPWNSNREYFNFNYSSTNHYLSIFRSESTQNIQATRPQSSHTLVSPIISHVHMPPFCGGRSIALDIGDRLGLTDRIEPLSNRTDLVSNGFDVDRPINMLIDDFFTDLSKRVLPIGIDDNQYSAWRENFRPWMVDFWDWMTMLHSECHGTLCPDDLGKYDGLWLSRHQFLDNLSSGPRKGFEASLIIPLRMYVCCGSTAWLSICEEAIKGLRASCPSRRFNEYSNLRLEGDLVKLFIAYFKMMSQVVFHRITHHNPGPEALFKIFNKDETVFPKMPQGGVTIRLHHGRSASQNDILNLDVRGYSKLVKVQEYIKYFIQEHATRVEQYKFALKCTALEVQTDIEATMNEVWNAAMDRVMEECPDCAAIRWCPM